MKTSIWLPASSALVLILSGCTNQNDPNDPLGTGPYDAQGNYHEEWADDPSKWRKPGKRPTTTGDDLPMVAQNDQPPPNANPLAVGSQKLPPVTAHQSGQEVEIASRSRTSSSAGKSRQTASSSEPKRSTRSSSSSRTKSKSKSSTTRHTVKKGDSLSSLAKKYGSSVSAIQKANGISGTLIRDGKTLVIPKKR